MLKTSLLILFLTCLTMQSRLLNPTYDFPVYSGMPPKGMIQLFGSFFQVSSAPQNLTYEFRGASTIFNRATGSPGMSDFLTYVSYQPGWFKMACQ